MSLQQHTLENGLVILGEPKPSAQSIAAGFFVRTGSRDETPEVSGVSHFLEHMMFKGTDRRSPEDVNREFDEMGASYNAFTSEESTVYYGAVLPEFQGRLLDLLSDMMRPALRGEDFDVEKQVILEEIALYQDRPQHIVLDLLRRNHFVDHPLGSSVLGSGRSVSALQPGQMQAYFSRRYVPDNMLLVLVGNYDWESAIGQVDAACGSWSRGAAGREKAVHVPGISTQVVTDERLNRAHMAFGFPGVSAQDPRRRAADVLSDVVGGPRNSRLYWALVEPGLADVAELFHEENDGDGWFIAYISCEPERAEEVHSRFQTVLAEVGARNIRADEVARTTRKGAAGLVIRGETPMGRLTTVGFDWMYRQKVESVDEDADALLAVTAQECNALLEEDPFRSMTTVAIGPLNARLEPAAASSNL